jgi:hypothetical protein
MARAERYEALRQIDRAMVRILRRLRVARNAPYPARHRAFRNVEAEHLQLVRRRDSLRQYRRKPAPCQRTMTWSQARRLPACCHPSHSRRTQTQKNLSEVRKLVLRRRGFNTANCCRRTRFSIEIGTSAGYSTAGSGVPSCGQTNYDIRDIGREA